MNSSYFLQSHPVTFVRCASALGRVLVLCEGSLVVLDGDSLHPIPLAGANKLKGGVGAGCINENPNSDDPFTVQVRREYTVLEYSLG